jgi:hypothetical protein
MSNVIEMVSGDDHRAVDSPRRYDAPLTVSEKLVYGATAQRDPASGFVFEEGVGSPPRAVQAEAFQRRLQDLFFLEAYRESDPNSLTAIPDIDERIRKLRGTKS